jgi:hypothetical protein
MTHDFVIGCGVLLIPAVVALVVNHCGLLKLPEYQVAYIARRERGFDRRAQRTVMERTVAVIKRREKINSGRAAVHLLHRCLIRLLCSQQ